MEDSYNDYAVKLMTADFCQRLMTFSSNERDNINEETVELMEPYLMLTMPATGEMLFTPEVANNTSKALGGLTTWCAAMSDYHK
jgi:dynein heavy chain